MDSSFIVYRTSLAVSATAEVSSARPAAHDSLGRRPRRLGKLPGRLAPTRARPSATPSMNRFLRDVQCEMRRAERSKAALSLLLFKFDEAPASGASPSNELLEILAHAKRETDVLGLIDRHTIAVLCPDTNACGGQTFIHRIDALAAHLSYGSVCATYPDHLFESLSRLADTTASTEVFLACDSTARMHQGYALKRGLDIVGALLALCLLAPLMLLVATAIALTSPGPVIYRQTRLGRGGVPFTFYKFRSMTARGDDSIHREFVARLIREGEAQAAASAAASAATSAARAAPFKLANDPRITPLGRFMRRTSIDELPQLFNVLRGDMSLVGPRPALAYEVANYQSWHLRRVLGVRPGITGLWQVAGRSRVSFNEMVRMDLRYIRDCSLALDLAILLRTVMVVLRCEGAV
jgi:lipopolysaccharide/colanic/teichoic acid biosynthesis glycosyltransferase